MTPEEACQDDGRKEEKDSTCGGNHLRNQATKTLAEAVAVAVGPTLPSPPCYDCGVQIKVLHRRTSIPDTLSLCAQAQMFYVSLSNG